MSTIQDRIQDIDAALGVLEGPAEPESLRALLEALRETALAALRESDEERDWDVYEDGIDADTITARGPEEALELAKQGVDPANYDYEGIRRVRVVVRCALTDEEAQGTVTLPPVEPECADAPRHEWRSDDEVQYRTGSVVRDVCAHCGCARETNTTDPERHTISYEPGE